VLTRDAYGIESRFHRSIAIGVCQKDWIQIRPDELFYNRLSYAICYGGHGCFELHFGPVRLWDLLRSPILFIRFAANGSLF